MQSTKENISALVLALLFLSSCGSGGAQDQPAEEIRLLVQRYADAYSRGNFEQLAAVFDQSPDFLLFESGYAQLGWHADVGHHFRDEALLLSSIEYKIEQLSAKVENNLAWATFEFSLKAKVIPGVTGKEALDMVGVGTFIFEKKDRDWKIVHAHLSSPQGTHLSLKK